MVSIVLTFGVPRRAGLLHKECSGNASGDSEDPGVWAGQGSWALQWGVGRLCEEPKGSIQGHMSIPGGSLWDVMGVWEGVGGGGAGSWLRADGLQSSAGCGVEWEKGHEEWLECLAQPLRPGPKFQGTRSGM